MIQVKRWPPGFHIVFPTHSLHSSSDQVGVTLTREEADALFDGLGAVLDRDAGLPKNRRMPAPPAPNGGADGG